MNSNEPIKNPLHGVTLEKLVTELQAHYGWEKLDEMLHMNCFHVNPSINSCLKFFRKTPWARVKIEKLYINFCKNQSK